MQKIHSMGGATWKPNMYQKYFTWDQFRKVQRYQKYDPIFRPFFFNILRPFQANSVFFKAEIGGWTQFHKIVLKFDTTTGAVKGLKNGGDYSKVKKVDIK